MDIEHDECFNYSINFSSKEKAMVHDFRTWLPDLIIDTHTHLSPSSCVENIPEEIQKQMCATFTYLSVKEAQKIKSELYPENKVISLCMPMPFKGINHRKANIYLNESLPSGNHPIFYGIPEDVDYTVNGMKDSKFKALKMYPFYFSRPDGQIYQYFKPEILKIANDLSLPIILHLPTKVTACLDQLQELLNTFPQVPVVLAHMGRERAYSAELDNIYAILKDYSNLFLETSTIPSTEVFESALRHFGENRIIFGSDEPYNLIRASIVNITNEKQRFLTKYKYNWVNEDEQKELHNQFANKVTDLMPIHFQNLYALREAINNTFLSDQCRERVKNKIFSINSINLFKITV